MLKKNNNKTKQKKGKEKKTRIAINQLEMAREV